VAGRPTREERLVICWRNVRRVKRDHARLRRSTACNVVRDGAEVRLAARGRPKMLQALLRLVTPRRDWVAAVEIGRAPANASCAAVDGLTTFA